MKNIKSFVATVKAIFVEAYQNFHQATRKFQMGE